MCELSFDVDIACCYQLKGVGATEGGLPSKIYLFFIYELLSLLGVLRNYTSVWYGIILTKIGLNPV